LEKKKKNEDLGKKLKGGKEIGVNCKAPLATILLK